jgi:raffinose/stachyose/melibiose transport system substrate-binding protein
MRDDSAHSTKENRQMTPPSSSRAGFSSRRTSPRGTVALATTVVTALALAGCGGSSSGASGAATTTTTTTTAASSSAAATSSGSSAAPSTSASSAAGAAATTAAPTTTDAAATGPKVSFTLSMQDPNVQTQDPGLWAVFQAFQAKYPNVHINVEGQPVEQHEQKLTIAAQSNTLPDVFWVYNALAQTMQSQGKLLDLGPILAENSLSTKFAPTMLSSFKQGGVQYGLPQSTLVTGFFYNKALFKQYNLALPVTFDDLLADAKVFSSHHITTIAQGANQSDFSVWAFLTMLDRYGYEQKIADIQSKKASYNNPEFLRLYTHIQELQKAGAFPSNVTTQTYVQAVQSFISGKAAMVDTGVWDASKLDQSPIAADVGFWPGPTFTDGAGKQQLVMNVASAPFAASAAVKKDTAKYNAVKAFFQFYSSDAAQQIFVKNALTPITTYKATVDAATHPAFSAVLNALTQPGWSSPTNQPDLVVSAQTSQAMYQSIYGVIEGALSPSAALKVVASTFK